VVGTENARNILQNFMKNILGKWLSGISRRCCDYGSQGSIESGYGLEF
jgi:hypothetical protein